jgi:hypothetical protein
MNLLKSSRCRQFLSIAFIFFFGHETTHAMQQYPHHPQHPIPGTYAPCYDPRFASPYGHHPHGPAIFAPGGVPQPVPAYAHPHMLPSPAHFYGHLAPRPAYPPSHYAHVPPPPPCPPGAAPYPGYQFSGPLHAPPLFGYRPMEAASVYQEAPLERTMHEEIWDLNLDEARKIFDTVEEDYLCAFLKQKNPFGNNILHQTLKRLALAIRNDEPAAEDLVSLACYIITTARDYCPNYTEILDVGGVRPLADSWSAEIFFVKIFVDDLKAHTVCKPLFELFGVAVPEAPVTSGESSHAALTPLASGTPSGSSSTMIFRGDGVAAPAELLQKESALPPSPKDSSAPVVVSTPLPVEAVVVTTAAARANAEPPVAPTRHRTLSNPLVTQSAPASPTHEHDTATLLASDATPLLAKAQALIPPPVHVVAPRSAAHPPPTEDKSAGLVVVATPKVTLAPQHQAPRPVATASPRPPAHLHQAGSSGSSDKPRQGPKKDAPRTPALDTPAHAPRAALASPTDTKANTLAAPPIPKTAPRPTLLHAPRPTVQVSLTTATAVRPAINTRSAHARRHRSSNHHRPQEHTPVEFVALPAPLAVVPEPKPVPKRASRVHETFGDEDTDEEPSDRGKVTNIYPAAGAPLSSSTPATKQKAKAAAAAKPIPVAATAGTGTTETPLPKPFCFLKKDGKKRTPHHELISWLHDNSKSVPLYNGESLCSMALRLRYFGAATAIITHYPLLVLQKNATDGKSAMDLIFEDDIDEHEELFGAWTTEVTLNDTLSLPELLTTELLDGRTIRQAAGYETTAAAPAKNRKTRKQLKAEKAASAREEASARRRQEAEEYARSEAEKQATTEAKTRQFQPTGVAAFLEDAYLEEASEVVVGAEAELHALLAEYPTNLIPHLTLKKDYKTVYKLQKMKLLTQEMLLALHSESNPLNALLIQLMQTTSTTDFDFFTFLYEQIPSYEVWLTHIKPDLIISIAEELATKAEILGYKPDGIGLTFFQAVMETAEKLKAQKAPSKAKPIVTTTPADVESLLAFLTTGIQDKMKIVGNPMSQCAAAIDKDDSALLQEVDKDIDEYGESIVTIFSHPLVSYDDESEEKLYDYYGALCHALANGSLKCIRYLLSKIKDIRAAINPETGATLLHTIFEQLIAGDERLGDDDKFYKKPVNEEYLLKILSAILAHPSVADASVRAAFINTPSRAGITALHHAAGLNNTTEDTSYTDSDGYNIVQLLLEQGANSIADYYSPDGTIRIALDEAIETSARVTALLMQQPDMECIIMGRIIKYTQAHCAENIHAALLLNPNLLDFLGAELIPFLARNKLYSIAHLMREIGNPLANKTNMLTLLETGDEYNGLNALQIAAKQLSEPCDDTAAIEDFIRLLLRIEPDRKAWQGRFDDKDHLKLCFAVNTICPVL